MHTEDVMGEILKLFYVWYMSMTVIVLNRIFWFYFLIIFKRYSECKDSVIHLLFFIKMLDEYNTILLL